jgi:PAS domain S-box-containing protein
VNDDSSPTRLSVERLARAGLAPAVGLAAVIVSASVVRLSRWKDRGKAGRAGEGDDPRVGAGPQDATDDEVIARLRSALTQTEDAREASARLFDELDRVLDVELALLAVVDEERRWATGFACRGGDEAWWRGVSLDLESEGGGIASAVRERSALAVYDVESASNVNRRLATETGAKSAAFVPLVGDGEAIGVLVLASTETRRLFSSAELELVQRLANETALALARARSAGALRAALDRERLIGEIARKVRSTLELDDVLQVAASETGRALGVARCFIRLGRSGEPMPVGAQWHLPGLAPLPADGERLPVSNLAARERRTVAVGDVARAAELDEPGLGGRETLLELGTRAVLATPIVVFDDMIGVFALHRTETGAWSASEIVLAEAVAGEIGLAIHAARLLHEDERRLEQQAALLKAAQVVTSDLRLETVLRRLVEEVATLFGADAADCWLFERGQNVLRSRAVFGLPASELGRRIPPMGTHIEALASGKPVLKRDFARTEDPPPSKSFADFEEVMVAPMTWLGERRGVLGVCSREAGRFHSSELELLDAFARFASLASHNAESFEERERQAQIQQGFYRVAEVLGSPLSLAETFDALAQAAAEALGGEAAAVLAPGAEGLVLAGSFQLPPPLAERFETGLAADATPFLAAASEERIVSSTGLGDDDRFHPRVRSLLVEHGYETLLSAPVRGSTGDNGAVVVLFRGERAFSDEDLALARHLSRAARGALERSELFETERRARSLSQRLAAIGARLATNLDPTRVLDDVVREAPSLLAGDAAVIRLLEGEELVVHAAAGSGTAGLVRSRSSSGAGVLGDAVQSRRPAAVEDARAAPHRGRGDPLLAGAMGACVAVPMTAHGGGLHGVLSVYSTASRGWRADEVQALRALAAVASAALSNAELYQRVAEEKERNDAILSNIADGIVAVDRDEQIVLWNSTAEQITGVPAAEALGRRISEALQRELTGDEDGPEDEREVAIMRGGKEVWLALTEAVMRDASGAVLGRIFAFRDVSGERAVEEMKSDFVATVSHELRTPLTSIYGFAGTLLREDVEFGEPERSTFVRYIASESERLIGIVDDLLNVARLDAGTIGLSLERTDVAGVVSDAVDAFAAGANGAHRFRVDIPERALYAEADPGRLVEIVHHLVDNAVKFSPDGGTITVSGRRKADTIEVRVADEGVGIPPSEHQRIFTKFYRGGGGSPSAHGTGVGLFLARGLVAAMHGRMWVESQEGAGSTFVFELPLANAHHTPHPVQP